MRTFGKRWFRDESLMADFSDHLGDAVARQKSTLALNAAKVEAELASKAKSEFIANMSHELRTPLNAIIGFSDMLGTVKMTDPNRVGLYAGYIKQAAEHLLALINGILDVSKIQAGKLEIEPEETDLHATIESCILILEAKAREKNITLTWSLEPDTPNVHADPLRMKQVLINILSNAVKFTGDGGAVELTAGASGHGFARICISDTGSGMAPNEIATAMLPFGQVNAGLNKSHEGTGLGLPISNALVRLHGGALDIQSTPGQGTSVIIHLPVNPPQTAAPTGGVAAVAAPGPSAASRLSH